MYWIKKKFRTILLFVSLCLLIAVGLYYDRNIIHFDKQLENQVVSMSIDLDSDGIDEKIVLKSHLGLPGEEKTEVYLNGIWPILTLYGFLDNVLTHDIDNSRYKFIELQLAAGHSINSLIYKYQKGVLKRIPVSTEKVPYFMGIVARNTPEFKDVDGDGVLEMFAYYRHFPPEKRRTVEIYKFNGEEFKRQKKYDETTPEIFL